jgi:hypothetical protein
MRVPSSFIIKVNSTQTAYVFAGRLGQRFKRLFGSFRVCVVAIAILQIANIF